MTYLYYWYDAGSFEEPGLTLHPPPGLPFDWSDPAWHRGQLIDMAEAGVDVALAVYWGDHPEWSGRGLDALVAARESLLAEGAQPPALGLFLDSNLFAALVQDDPDLADLTSGPGLEMLVAQIAGFFDRVPPCHRASIDGRPLIFLWRPDTEDDHVLRFDETTFDALYARLEERLGSRPYVVRERTWDAYARAGRISLQTDGIFEWGASLKGPRLQGRTVAVGPGYDDRSLPGRPGYVRDREGGRAYERDLRAAALSGSPWLLLETWNELWEGTAIAETAEHGRAYLELTRRYVQLFRQLGGEEMRDAWADLGTGESTYLDWLADAWQERGTWAIADGRAGARPASEPDEEAGYFHFAVRPRTELAGPGPASVLVEYFDEGSGSFGLEYDSVDPEAPEDGAFKPTPTVDLEGMGRWRWQTFELPDARFARRQYGGHGDFRIRDLPVAGEPGHVFGRVIVRTEPGARPVLLGPESLATLPATGGGSVELHWLGVEGAVDYLVQLGPFDAAEPRAPHGYVGADGRACSVSQPGPGQRLTQALTAEDRCRVNGPASAPPGQLYRWRVLALDASGAQIGPSSDWGFLLTGE